MGVYAGELDITKLKIGDVIYEYDMNMLIKSTVRTLPQKDNNGIWSWTCDFKNRIKNYMVEEEYSWLSPKLYDYIPYEGCTIIG